MNQLKNLIDRVIFFVLCVALIAIFVWWKGGCNLKVGGPGIGQPGGPPNGQLEQQGTPQDPVSPEQNPNTPALEPQEQQSSPSPPGTGLAPTVNLFLGRKGVSEDQVTWYDIGEFAGFIEQLQEKGVKGVQYTLLPDSIERYEERWAEELRKANIRSYINTD